MAFEMGGRVNTRSKDKNNNRQAARITLRSTNDAKESYLQEIRKLEEELIRLESQIDKEESGPCCELSSDGTIERVLLDLKESCQTPTTPNETSSTETLQSQDASLVCKISSLTSITGIHFDMNQCSAVLQSASKTTWKRHLKGCCRKIPFCVEFEVDEFDLEQGTSDREGQ